MYLVLLVVVVLVVVVVAAPRLPHPNGRADLLRDVDLRQLLLLLSNTLQFRLQFLLIFDRVCRIPNQSKVILTLFNLIAIQHNAI